MQGKFSYAILDLLQNNKHSRFPFDTGAEFLFRERDLTPRIVVACFLTFVVVMSIIPN
nr:MAG TPA: hypothetical protein [Caudoviricetes sp.]